MKTTLSIAVALLGSAMLVAQQPNNAAGSMTVNFLGSAGPGPFVAPIQPPASATLTFTAPANTPFTIFNANPAFGGFAAAPGLATPFGFVDLQPLGFPPIEIVIDGIANQGNLLGAFANTGSTGSRALTASFGSGVGCSTSALVLGNLQTLFQNPASPGGFSLSAAYTLQVPAAPLPDTASVAVSNCDDCYTQVSLSNCNAFNFYGVPYNRLFVGSNGYITFNAGDTSLGESQAGFQSGSPRISVFWDDLYPTSVTALRKYDDGVSFTASWTNCPEFAVSNANTFSINLDYATGNITLTYGAVAAQDGLCGITPGTNLGVPATVFATGGANGDILSRLSGNPYFGGPLESMNQIWVPPTSIFNLANSVVHFQPVPGSGNTAYVMF